MADISDPPMLHYIDADYSPQDVEVTRVRHNKAQSGEYQPWRHPVSSDLASEYKVSIKVTYDALAMLMASGYVSRSEAFTPHSVIWQVRIASRILLQESK